MLDDQLIAFQQKRGINVEGFEQKKKERLDQQLKDFMTKAQENKEEAPAATEAKAEAEPAAVVEAI